MANTASGLAQLGWQVGEGAMRAAARLTSSMNAQELNTVSGLVTLGWHASEEWAGSFAASLEALLTAPARFSKPGLMLMQLLWAHLASELLGLRLISLPKTML